MKTLSVKNIHSIGIQETYDLEVGHSDHNFYANGLVTSNSHAVAYASLSALTIYLKFKYPKEFFLSLLKMTKHEPDPISEISKIQKELHHFGIKLLPPHLIKSQMDFSIEGDNIRFGLSSIKGIADKTIEKLNDFKHEYSNKFEIFQAANQAGLNIGVLSSLIQAGTLEGFKQSRSKVVYEAQLWNILTDNEKKICYPLGEKHNYDLVAAVKEMITLKNEKGKPLVRPSRFETIKKKSQPYKEIYAQNSKSEDFCNWFYSNKLCGYSFDKTLKEIFSEKRLSLEYINDINNKKGGYVIFVGKIGENNTGISKAKKTKYFKSQIEDETGSITTLIFNDKMEGCKEMNGDSLPKEGDIVIVKGKKMEDCVFADLISVQSNKIYSRLADLKNTEK